MSLVVSATNNRELASCNTDDLSMNSKRHATHAELARRALMNRNKTSPDELNHDPLSSDSQSLSHPQRRMGSIDGHALASNGVGAALSDSPMPTAPNSPRIGPVSQNPMSSTSTPRIRPTTLDVPGLTRSKASPDGRIPPDDLSAKLLIVMVGLPARGKSYTAKQIADHLNWLQHKTTIFNVGERRRLAAGSGGIDGESDSEKMDQGAGFFDPNNTKAAQMREQCAMDTLDEAMDYLIDGPGSVAIMDATNSTIQRRNAIRERVNARCGASLTVVFVELRTDDKQLLESNMCLKLSGPDYKGKDPRASAEDFRKRVAIYEKNYDPIGDEEERMGVSFIQVIDVNRKLIAHKVRGCIASEVVCFLHNFDLAPRMIWVTRHGESEDNIAGKIGGDSPLTDNGHKYGNAVAKLISSERECWEAHQRKKAEHSHFPPLPGDMSPPNPHYSPNADSSNAPSFCVWTSMEQRSEQMGQKFENKDLVREQEYHVKAMRMLDGLNAGKMQGMTNDQFKDTDPDGFEMRKFDKLNYRYPGNGGEGYLDVISRVRSVILELERSTDHVALITHHSVTRVLLAYFLGLDHNSVAGLDCPLGILHKFVPKPYGVALKAYRYDAEKGTFDDYEPELLITG